MTENQISKIIVDCAYQLHVAIGPGCFESVYETILTKLLTDRGLRVQTQVTMPVYWEGEKLDRGFVIDMLVEDKVIIELKSVEALQKVHYKQVITYLKLSDKRLGLLVNFNEALIKDGIKRVVNRL